MHTLEKETSKIKIINYIIQFLFLRIWHIDCTLVKNRSYYTLVLGQIPFTGMAEFGRPARFIYDKYNNYDFLHWIGIRKVDTSKLKDEEFPPIDIFLRYTD